MTDVARDTTQRRDEPRIAGHRFSTLAEKLTGSLILAIGAEVRALAAGGKPVCNLTVGDFSPTEFSIPTALLEGVVAALRAAAPRATARAQLTLESDGNAARRADSRGDLRCGAGRECATRARRRRRASVISAVRSGVLDAHLRRCRACESGVAPPRDGAVHDLGGRD